MKEGDFERMQGEETAETRRVRLEEAADVYRKGMVSHIGDVCSASEEEEVMQIAGERDFADKIAETKVLATSLDKISHVEDIRTVFDSFIDALSEESKEILREALSKKS